MSLETCTSNLKSVTLTILNWSDWPVHCTQTHRHTQRHTSNENSISAIHSVHSTEIIIVDIITRWSHTLWSWRRHYIHVTLMMLMLYPLLLLRRRWLQLLLVLRLLWLWLQLVINCTWCSHVLVDSSNISNKHLLIIWLINLSNNTALSCTVGFRCQHCRRRHSRRWHEVCRLVSVRRDTLTDTFIFWRWVYTQWQTDRYTDTHRQTDRQSCSLIHESGLDNPFQRYGHLKFSKMAGGRLLDLVQPEVAPFDPLSPKTLP